MAVGDVGKWRGNGTDALPTSEDSWEGVEFATPVGTPASIYSQNANDIDIQINETGFYLAVYRVVEPDSNSGNRNILRVRALFNSVVQHNGYGCGWIRNANNDHFVSEGHCLFEATTTGQNFRVEALVRGEDSTPEDNIGVDSELVLIRLPADTAAAYARYQDSADTTAYGTTSWDNVTWNSILDETDTSVIQRQSGNAAIRLKKVARYLVGYTITFQYTNRGQRIGRATLAGTEIPQSNSHCYLRDTDTDYNNLTALFIVDNDTINQDLEIEVQRGNCNLSGGSRVANSSGLFVIELPSSAEVVIGNDATGNQETSVTTPAQLNWCRTTPVIDSAAFTRNDNTTIEVEKAGYYLFMYNGRANRGSSSGTRQQIGARWTKNDIDQETISMSYVRGLQSSNHTYDGAVNGSFAADLAVNDEIECEVWRAGDSGLAQTVGGSCGMSALYIPSLVGGVTHNLTGSADGDGDADGELKKTRSIAGTADGTGDADGILKRAKRFISTTIVAAATCAALLSVTLGFTGTSDGLSTCSGDLTIPSGAIQALNGTADGAGDATASLTKWKGLNASTEDAASNLLGSHSVENWVSESNLDNWGEAESGDGIVRREETPEHVKHGRRSARLDLSGGSGTAGISEASVAANDTTKTYTLSIWHKGTASLRFIISDKSTLYLQDDLHSWGSYNEAWSSGQATYKRWRTKCYVPNANTKEFPVANVTASNNIYVDLPVWRESRSQCSGNLKRQRNFKRKNILLDPSFEDWAAQDDLTYWTEVETGSSKIDKETTTVRSALHSCALVIDGSSSWANIEQRDITVQSSKWYYFKGWGARDTDGNQLEFRLIDITNSQYLRPNSTKKYGSTTHWFRVSTPTAYTWYKGKHPFKTQSNTIEIRIIARRPGGGANEKWFWDDFEIALCTIACEATVSGSLTVETGVPLQGTADGTGGADAALSVTKEFSGTADGVAGCDGELSRTRSMRGLSEPDNLITDGELEDWASATDLNNWTETTSGSSTINRDTDAFQGVYSLRADIDVGGGNAYIYQDNVQFGAAGVARLKIAHKREQADTYHLYWRLHDTGNNVYWDDDLGRWQGSPKDNRIQSGADWARHVSNFLIRKHPDYTNYRIFVSRDGVLSDEWVKWDDIRLFTPNGTCNGELTVETTTPLQGTADGSGGADASLSRTRGFFGKAREDTNLDENLDFEVWPASNNCDRWTETVTGSATITEEATEVVSGHRAADLYISPTGTPTDTAEFRNNSITLAANTEYVLRLRYKMSAGTHPLRIRVYDDTIYESLQADGSWGAGTTFNLPNSLTWVSYSLRFKTPGYTGYRMYLREGLGSASINFWVDDLAFSIPSSYCDGELSKSKKLTGTADGVAGCDASLTKWCKLTGDNEYTDRPTNGTLDSWASATDLNSWTEFLSGSSTLNREATVVKQGQYSCRFDIVSGSYVYCVGGLSTWTAGDWLKLSVWHNIPIGTNGYLRIRVPGVYSWNPTTMQWVSGGHDIPVAGTGGWSKFSLEFPAYDGAATHQVHLYCTGQGTYSAYWDDVRARKTFGQCNGELSKSIGLTGTADGSATCDATLTKWRGFTGTSDGTAAKQSPGDELNESWEGVGAENTWSTSVGGGSSQDKDNTELTPPAGGGYETLKLVHGTPDYLAQVYWDRGGETTEAYFEAYVRVASEGLADGNWLWLIRVGNDSGQPAQTLRLQQVGSDLKFRCTIYTNTGTYSADYPAAGSISLNTWYKVKFRHDAVNDVYEAIIDGTVVHRGNLEDTHRSGVGRIYVGEDADQAATYYVDLLRLDSNRYSGVWAKIKKKLSATADGTGTCDGALTVEVGAVPIDGTADGTSTCDGELSRTRGITGTADGVGAGYGDAGAPRITKKYTATADGQATADADIKRTRSLTATADGQSTCDADISLSKDLTGTADGQATAGAELKRTKAISGTADGQASCDGEIKRQRKLIATSDGVGGADAGLSGTFALTGSADGQATCDGDLTLQGQVTLAGAAAGEGGADALLSATYETTGTADGQSTADGEIKRTRNLSAAADGAATCTGALTVEEGFILIDGTADGAATADGELKRARKLDGTSDGISTVSGDITKGAEETLAGVASGVASVDGAIKRARSIQGSSAANSTAGAALRRQRKLVGETDGAASVAGTLVKGAEVTLQAASAGTSTAGADLKRTRSISSAADGVATADALLTVWCNFNGVSAGEATCNGYLSLTVARLKPLPINGVSTASADLSPWRGLTGTSDGTSTCSGYLAFDFAPILFDKKPTQRIFTITPRQRYVKIVPKEYDKDKTPAQRMVKKKPNEYLIEFREKK